LPSKVQLLALAVQMASTKPTLDRLAAKSVAMDRSQIAVDGAARIVKRVVLQALVTHRAHCADSDISNQIKGKSFVRCVLLVHLQQLKGMSFVNLVDWLHTRLNKVSDGASVSLPATMARDPLMSENLLAKQCARPETFAQVSAVQSHVLQELARQYKGQIVPINALSVRPARIKPRVAKYHVCHAGRAPFKVLLAPQAAYNILFVTHPLAEELLQIILLQLQVIHVALPAALESI